MAEIRDGVFVRNETNEKSMGGTELLTMQLADRLEVPLLQEFQIVSSRVRDLQEDKIRIFWAHDLPGDPESEFLSSTDGKNKFHKFVFVSNWQMQRYIERYNLPWSKCVVINNAITPFDKSVIEKPDTKEQINLIYHSTPHRGLNILVPVFTELCKKYDNLHLDVFSSFKLYGWEQRDEHFKHLFNIIDEHPNMTNHGTALNDVVRSHLAKAHIFAYPSTWAETSCLCLIEAMSAGVASVHSNFGALSETASNWTQMYQYHEDLQQHASLFYGMLDHTIQNIEYILNRTQTAKSYADFFHNWDGRTHEWDALLKNLLASVQDRSIPKQMFSYSTGT